MRMRPLPLIAGIFGAAGFTAAFVVAELTSRQGNEVVSGGGSPAMAAPGEVEKGGVGDAAGASARLERDDARVRTAAAGTGAAEGFVRDLAGRSLAGARVRVVQRGDGLAGRPPLEARTGFDGAWRIEGIEPGRAEIVAHEEGVLAGISRAVRIAPGRPSRADFILPEAGLLAGRVLASGKPAPAGTTVIAVAMRAGLGGLQAARATADASGSYALSLPAGEYRVHAAPAEAARTDLRVAPAFARVEPRRTARLDLAAANASEEDGVKILVLEPGGAPSAGAVVTLARPDDGAVAFAAAAGEDGTVVIARGMGVAGRSVAVRARNGGRTGGATLALPPAGTVRVTLAPGGAVEGVVRARGRAVAGFTVEVASQPERAGWRTVDAHRFPGDRFELGDLPPEPLRLTIRTDDGRRGEAELRLAPGELRTVAIELGR